MNRDQAHRMPPLVESSRPDPVVVWSDRIGRGVVVVVVVALALLCVVAAVRP